MGDRWVFLRGLARRQEHWAGFLELFRAKVPGAEIEALDLAGNGTERQRSAFTRISQFTDDVRSRSRLLKQGPVRVVAISLGGMVAADWASRFPEELLSVHLINTSDRRHSPFWDRLRPGTYPVLLKAFLERHSAIDRERTVLSIVSNASQSQRDRWAEQFARLEPCRSSEFLKQIVAALRYAPPSQSPRVPVTLLSSKGDRLVDPACSLRLAQAWGARHLSHPTAGHDLPLDAPEWVAENVLTGIVP